MGDKGIHLFLIIVIIVNCLYVPLNQNLFPK